MSKFEHFLTMDNLNPALKSIDFSKNEVVQRAKDIEKELLTNDLSEKKPFENLTYLNIDDFQSIGQKPITYYRQVTFSIAIDFYRDMHSYFTDNLGYDIMYISFTNIKR